MAVNALNIYGDKFAVGSEAVTGIGNNVTVALGHFSFDEAPSEVIIKGRSKLATNSIHLTTEGGEPKRYQLEFSGCEDYTERSFPLESFPRECDISLFFLPGSDFDLMSIRFR